MATLLSIVQTVSQEVNVPEPSFVVTNKDQIAKQMLAMVNRMGVALTDRYQWQILTEECNHTSIAAESQGVITTIASGGFLEILNETFWNRSQSSKIKGPLNAEAWQAEKGRSISSGINSFYRIRGNNLLITPTMAAGDELYFEYLSENWAQSSDGLTNKSSFTADTDVPRLDTALIELGAKWLYLKAKGLPYAEDFRLFETRLAKRMAADGGKPRLSMGGRGRRRPAANLPDGSWVL